ncbi:hypothetical protein CC86DRAFT_69053 [Ophiobolus disseminans]|uniref:Uncharacterized protein n=1 Tax=Ophiobolus disseminans TaxID=1469910 RepID=A0A6A6ZRX1_9PLEO|nr:hypothetical protein CC86DRAFT_69053 [Ophiobolus disseminans]
MSDKSITLSAREMEVLALAWQCMEAQPKIDMNKLAQLTGYTPRSASVTFGNIKRKIKLLGEGLAANGPTTPKKGGGHGRAKAGPTTTPKSTGKRSAKAAANGDDDIPDPEETPTKRAKKAGSKKAREDLDDDEEEFNFGRIKKEEIDDIHNSATGLYDQMSRAAAGSNFGCGLEEGTSE